MNVVEIDLLRGDEPITLAGRNLEWGMKPAAYHASVWRPAKPDLVAYYPILLRDPLPTIRIPLRERDEDVTLDLQAILQEAIRKGRHGELLDYCTDPEPPLDEKEAAWAGERTGR